MVEDNASAREKRPDGPASYGRGAYIGMGIASFALIGGLIAGGAGVAQAFSGAGPLKHQVVASGDETPGKNKGDKDGTTGPDGEDVDGSKNPDSGTDPTDPNVNPDHDSDPQVKEDVVHEVVWGETLTSISLQYGVSVDQLALYNQINDPNLIYADSALRVPYLLIPQVDPETGLIVDPITGNPLE